MRVWFSMTTTAGGDISGKGRQIQVSLDTIPSKIDACTEATEGEVRSVSKRKQDYDDFMRKEQKPEDGATPPREETLI